MNILLLWFGLWMTSFQLVMASSQAIPASVQLIGSSRSIASIQPTMATTVQAVPAIQPHTSIPIRVSVSSMGAEATSMRSASNASADLVSTTSLPVSQFFEVSGEGVRSASSSLGSLPQGRPSPSCLCQVCVNKRFLLIIASQNSLNSRLTTVFEDFKLELQFTDLIKANLGHELIIRPDYIISGVGGVLHHPASRLRMRSGEPVSCMFGAHEIDIMRRTEYNMLEIFLDTIFGLQPGVEGIDRMESSARSLGGLVKSKFNFTIGLMRDGRGQPYGTITKPNHFSDRLGSSGYFDCPNYPSRRVMGQAAPRITPGGNVVEFFKAHHANNDYTRLESLFGIFTNPKALSEARQLSSSSSYAVSSSLSPLSSSSSLSLSPLSSLSSVSDTENKKRKIS